MPVAIDFTVLGEKQLSRELLRFSERAVNATPAWVKIIEDMMDQIAEQFDSEGNRGSGGWAQLKPETILFKQREGYPLDILLRTQALRDSLIARGAPHQILDIFPDRFTFGSDLFYGNIHMKGSPSTNLPARKPVDFTETDRRGYVNTLQRWIVTGEVL